MQIIQFKSVHYITLAGEPFTLITTVEYFILMDDWNFSDTFNDEKMTKQENYHNNSYDLQQINNVHP